MSIILPIPFVLHRNNDDNFIIINFTYKDFTWNMSHSTSLSDSDDITVSVQIV